MNFYNLILVVSFLFAVSCWLIIDQKKLNSTLICSYLSIQVPSIVSADIDIVGGITGIVTGIIGGTKPENFEDCFLSSLPDIKKYPTNDYADDVTRVVDDTFYLSRKILKM